MPYEFADRISIRELSPIRWDVSIVKGFISERERDDLANTRYWLCAAKEYEHVYGDVGEELYDAAHAAAMALQVICPAGATQIFLKFQRTSEGWDNVGSYHPKELCRTLLGRITHLEDQGLSLHFDAVYAGIRRSRAEKLVRLQNPVLLLEHGMQIGNVNLGSLMFVMALDTLFMAGAISPFVRGMIRSRREQGPYVERRSCQAGLSVAICDLWNYGSSIWARRTENHSSLVSELVGRFSIWAFCDYLWTRVHFRHTVQPNIFK